MKKWCARAALWLIRPALRLDVDNTFAVAKPGDTVVLQVPGEIRRFLPQLRQTLNAAGANRNIGFLVLMGGERIIDVCAPGHSDEGGDGADDDGKVISFI